MAPSIGLENSVEVTVLASLLFTPHGLEDRIRQAYLRRNPLWVHTLERSRVWAIAASNLLAAHQADPDLPLDPELFVASQPGRNGLADPWGDLTRPASLERYRGRVRRIVRRLRRELKSEIRWARKRLDRGKPIELVLSSRSPLLTPLVRYILAVQEMRDDLAFLFLEAAVRQHESCPLYRLACLGMLPEASYPVEVADRFEALDSTAPIGFSVN